MAQAYELIFEAIKDKYFKLKDHFFKPHLIHPPGCCLAYEFKDFFQKGNSWKFKYITVDDVNKMLLLEEVPESELPFDPVTLKIKEPKPRAKESRLTGEIKTEEVERGDYHSGGYRQTDTGMFVEDFPRGKRI